uniref:iron-sulfur cluster assembly scaffold protein n=1 Tax=Aeromonas taiwanensis TaxID=633417 RepID=UPI00248E5CB3
NSFVNGQHTTQGGTHQSAFKEHIARTIKEFFGKYEFSDIRNGIVAAIALNVEEPIFESQTKIKLGSLTMSPNGESINKYVGDFIKKEVDNFLHINTDIAEELALPPVKIHCSILAEDAIKAAIADYKQKKGL